MTTNFSQTAAYIWSLADLLRGDFKQSQYGRVILPFTILRRLECVLEGGKPKVLEQAEKLKAMAKLEEDAREKFLLKAAGQSFYNTSPMDLSRLGSSDIKSNLLTYVDSFSPDAREIFEHFRFDEFVTKLSEANLLFKVVQKVATTDLSPKAISNHDMGLVFEELIRRFAESSNETAGEHFTPRDIVRLTTSLVFMEDDDALTEKGIIRTIYDPTAGTGGFLSSGMEYVHELNPGAVMRAFGQELNPESYAICKGDMLIKGQDVSRIKLGNTLSDDQLHSDRFDYMLSNPPFSVDWKKVEKDIKEEQKLKGFDGRFGPGLPRVSDGFLLFLMHMIAKMRPPTEGGSRIGIVLNGSPLFTGDAGSGESEIRRWIIENDWLETVVALPDQLFYNTSISTYIWILTNRKEPRRKGKVQLINGIDFSQKVDMRMLKSIGLKRNHLADEHISGICRLYDGFSRCANVKILDNEDFGYRRIALRHPLMGDEEAGAAESRPFRRSYEKVPLKQDIAEFIRQNVLPLHKGATVDEGATKIGYGFERISHFGFGLERAVERLRKQYGNCRLIPLGRMCTEISKPPRQSKVDRTSQPSAAPTGSFLIRGIKVQPDEQAVLAAYLEMFFATKLGDELVSELVKGMMVPAVNPNDLSMLVVPVPTLDEQAELLSAKSRIDQLADLLLQLETQLAANPENMDAVNASVISALSELGQVPAVDVVRGLVRGGESKRVEFKETFSLDVRKQSKEAYIEVSALKTIVAFLNSDGGDLLIGVVDDGQLAGVKHELDKLHKGSSDKFLLHLKNKINKSIGAEYYPLLEQELVKVGEVEVLHISCKASSMPVFLDNEDFYVRTNPATDKLTGRKQADYISGRFQGARAAGGENIE